MDPSSRIFPVKDFTRQSEGDPVRSVVLATDEASIIVWHARPGQEIAAHTHPHSQDTWTVISGSADYFQGDGVVKSLKAGDIAVAKPNQVHGAKNTGTEPFIFVSVVSPGNPGFALAEK